MRYYEIVLERSAAFGSWDHVISKMIEGYQNKQKTVCYAYVGYLIRHNADALIAHDAKVVLYKMGQHYIHGAIEVGDKTYDTNIDRNLDLGQAAREEYSVEEIQKLLQ